MIEKPDVFLKNLEKELPLYIKHDFIANSQTQYLSFIKEKLKQGEFLVTLDFAENYSFKIQDAIQSYHWSNDQATLHPYVIYYKHETKVVNESFVIISENNKHDAMAVHMFNKKMIHHLQLIYGSENVKKIFFFSDGCAAQYKNKLNFINLLHYKTDFNVDTEWHFFATSHGKGACDGIGGTVKRLASRTSLQRPHGKQITTPYELYQWAAQYFDNIVFEFSTQKEYDIESKQLRKRFKNAKPIKGTRAYHAFIPVDCKRIACKNFSSSINFDVHKIT